MGFLWGLIMFVLCHTLANMAANNLYCYIQEKKSDEANENAIKQYIIKAIISIIVYIVILVIGLTVKTFSKYTAFILIGNGIGFITGFVHFYFIADTNYLKQKIKNGWTAPDYLMFDGGDNVHNSLEKNGTHSKNQLDLNEYIFQEYSLEGFMDYIEEEIGERDAFFTESLLRVLRVEKISFEQLIRDLDIISPKYAPEGEYERIGFQYRLYHFFDFFTNYIGDVRLKRMSIDRFYLFLKREAKTNEIYKKNYVASDENIAEAIFLGKRPIRLKVDNENAEQIINILDFILNKKGVDIYWLAEEYSLFFEDKHADWLDECKHFVNPSLSDVLCWFREYLRYEKREI